MNFLHFFNLIFEVIFVFLPSIQIMLYQSPMTNFKFEDYCTGHSYFQQLTYVSL